MSREISNMDDVIDSRDVIERIEELEAIDGIQDTIDNLIEDDDAKELVSLRQLAEQAEGYAADWQYGEQLIRDSYFVDYIEQLIDDCYSMPKEFKSGDWPWRHMKIDYEAAAEEAKQDYTSVTFDGVTYWVR